MALAKPRVNASLVPQYLDQTVIVMVRALFASEDGRLTLATPGADTKCQCLMTNGAMSSILCTDRGQVTVRTAGPLVVNAFYELECKIDNRGELHEISRLALNPEFDLDGMNEVIKLSHTPQLSPLFQ